MAATQSILCSTRSYSIHRAYSWRRIYCISRMVANCVPTNASETDRFCNGNRVKRTAPKAIRTLPVSRRKMAPSSLDDVTVMWWLLRPKVTSRPSLNAWTPRIWIDWNRWISMLICLWRQHWAPHRCGEDNTSWASHSWNRLPNSMEAAINVCAYRRTPHVWPPANTMNEHERRCV